jgi:hypothetical protein
MWFLRFVGLAIITPLFVVALLVSVLGISARPFLHPDVYLESFSQNNVYVEIDKHIGTEDNPFIREIFKDEDTQELIERLFTTFLAYARGDTQELNLPISTGTAVQDFFEERAAALPVCQANQIEFNGDVPSCRPSNISSSDFLGQYLSENEIDVPKGGEVNLVESWNGEKNAKVVQEKVQQARLGFYGSFILMALLGLSVFFIKKRSIPRTIRYLGVWIFIVGLLGYIGSTIARGLIKTQIPDLGEFAFAEGVALDLSGALLGNILLYGGILIGLGIVMIIVSIIFRGKNTKT